MTVFFDARFANREYGYWEARETADAVSGVSHVGDARDNTGAVVASAPVSKADLQVAGFRGGDVATQFKLDDWAAVTSMSHEYTRNFHLASNGAWDGANGFIGTTKFYGVRQMAESPYAAPTAFCVMHQINYPTVLFNPISFNLNPLISTTLTGNVASGGTTVSVPVADRTGIVNADTTLRIDNEWLLVTAGGGTTGAGNVTCSRAVAGTTADAHLSGATVKNSAVTMDLNFGKAIQTSAGSFYDSTLGFQLRRWPVDILRLDTWFEVIYEVKYSVNYGDGGYIKVYYRLPGRATPGAWTTIFDSRTNNYNTPDFTTTGNYDAGGTPTMQWGTVLGAQATTFLSTSINGTDSSTTLSLGASGSLQTGDTLRIDSEYMLVTSGGGTTAPTVTRGYFGTSKAAHTGNPGGTGLGAASVIRLQRIDTHGQFISAPQTGYQGIIDKVGLYRGGNVKSAGTTQQSATIMRCDRFVGATTFAEVENLLNGEQARETQSFFPTTPKFTGTLDNAGSTYTNPEIRCKVTALPDNGNRVELQLCKDGSNNFYAFLLYNDGTKSYMAYMYEVLSNSYGSFGMANPFNDSAGNTIQANDWIGASVRLDPNDSSRRVLRFFWRRAASTTWTLVGSAVSLNTTIGSPLVAGRVNVTKTGGVAAFDANVMGGTGSVLVAA